MESKDYQTIFDQSSLIMVVLSADYTIEAASRGFLKATLNGGKNIKGLNIFDVFPEIGEHIEQVLINSLRVSLDKVLKEKKIDTTPVVRFDIPSGDEFDNRYWKAINTPILDDNNDVQYINQVYVDVTDSKKLSMQLELEKENLEEHKTAEEYIRDSLKLTPVPVCVLRGPFHRFELVNKEFLRIAGKHNYIGRPVREVLPELEGQVFFELLDYVYESEKPHVGVEMPITFESRPKLYVDIVYQMLHDAKGDKKGVFVAVVDVTDRIIARKKLQGRTEELNKANKELFQQYKKIERQKEELEVFTYVSSHDLKEPLRKIQLFAGRVRHKEHQNLSEKGLRYFELMQDAAKRMQVLIGGLQTFSSFQSDGQIFEEVDLKSLIEEVKLEYEDIIEEKNATVEVADMCRVPVITYQFRQLIGNLISNALKYSKPDTPPHIVITGKDEPGEVFIQENPSELADDLKPEIKYCRISVEDNGIGFNACYAKRIFKVFQRLHLSDEFEGIGIGLAIVKKIVENHQGVITAKGKLGEGALFEIYLPVE